MNELDIGQYVPAEPVQFCAGDAPPRQNWPFSHGTPFVAVPSGQLVPAAPVQLMGCAVAPVQYEPCGHLMPFVLHDAGQ